MVKYFDESVGCRGRRLDVGRPWLRLSTLASQVQASQLVTNDSDSAQRPRHEDDVQFNEEGKGVVDPYKYLDLKDLKVDLKDVDSDSSDGSNISSLLEPSFSYDEDELIDTIREMPKGSVDKNLAKIVRRYDSYRTEETEKDKVRKRKQKWKQHYFFDKFTRLMDMLDMLSKKHVGKPNKVWLSMYHVDWSMRSICRNVKGKADWSHEDVKGKADWSEDMHEVSTTASTTDGCLPTPPPPTDADSWTVIDAPCGTYISSSL